MVTIFKKLQDWERNRVERKYSHIIDRYSPKDQEIIKKGKAVLVTQLNRVDLEKATGSRVIYIPDCQISSEAGYMTYARAGLFGRDYKGNVECWLELGKLGVDALVNSFVVGPDGFSSLVGRPAKIFQQKPVAEK